MSQAVLEIRNFKCFTDARARLNGLTVLAGTNGAGKSTLIQSLLLLRSTYDVVAVDLLTTDIPIRERHIALNGPYCLALGNSAMVLNKHAGGDISIGISQGASRLRAFYRADPLQPQLSLELATIEATKKEFPISKLEFYYLNAERHGPRVQQELKHTSFEQTGWFGERTAQLLDRQNGYWKIEEERCYPDVKSRYISDQANAWLNWIMPGVRIRATTDSQTLSSQILVENRYTESRPAISTNVGFGISYILPIIVSALSAEKGAFLIVENPEAHLHPAAQSKISQFLARMADCGLSVIVETHSDHVLSGIQIAVASGRVKSTDVTINYFEDVGGPQPSISEIEIKDNGSLSAWPKGFFDQSQRDLATLTRLRKG
jgi:predicted ATPase